MTNQELVCIGYLHLLGYAVFIFFLVDFSSEKPTIVSVLVIVIFDCAFQILFLNLRENVVFLNLFLQVSRYLFVVFSDRKLSKI